MIQVNIIKYSKIKWCYYFSDKISKKWLFFLKGGGRSVFGYEKLLNFIFLSFKCIKKILKISSSFCKFFWRYVWFEICLMLSYRRNEISTPRWNCLLIHVIAIFFPSWEEIRLFQVVLFDVFILKFFKMTESKQNTARFMW